MSAHDKDLDAARPSDREPSAVRETGADVADALRGVVRPFVADEVSRVSFMLLAVLLVPVGIVIVAVGFVAMALAYNALGAPDGILASAITIAGLLGIVAALFFSFRALYRRMPRALRAAYAEPMRSGPPVPARTPVDTASGAQSATAAPGSLPATPAATLAELDARLAPTPTERPDR